MIKKLIGIIVAVAVVVIIVVGAGEGDDVAGLERGGINVAGEHQIAGLEVGGRAYGSTYRRHQFPADGAYRDEVYSECGQ